ncbi:dienelactone hydrolase [Paenibacillus sp. DS2015]|uniref:alpha/beta fold hydrolase n=1 Tax=Paenibacillus sp. DS2015 TaxID=3373917 RepID=UPI003D1DC6C4
MRRKSIALQTAVTVTLALSLVIPLNGAAAAAKSDNKENELTSVRLAASTYGAKVSWNQASRTVTITKGSITVVFKVGETQALVNGQTTPIGDKVSIVGNQAFVPMDFITQIFKDEEDIPTSSLKTVDLFLTQLKSGQGSKVTAYMSPALKEALPTQVLNILWSNYEQVYGKFVSQSLQTEDDNAVHHNITYDIQTDKIPFSITLRLNPQGQVDDLYMAPTYPSTYKKPDYDHPSTYIEEEVTVGDGEFALPGTLTKPIGNGPFPVVVLVHGSGTNNRDTSIGGAKPFRDLAVGLASKDIAVLRYDKVTYEHTFKISSDPKLTLNRETVDDALNAVTLLKNMKDIDPTRIYVAGHSQGGFAMPLIVKASKDKAIAGTILLSAPSSKFIDVLVEQLEEIVSRFKELGQDTSIYEAQSAQVISLAKIVNDPQYSVDHLPDNFPMQPAYWWFEQRDYKPSDLAKTQTGPMLVLQGENDYQVPIRQYNDWKKELKDRSDVAYKSYPHVNHLLSEYAGVSVGAEYMQPSNVAPAIIDDIADWIKNMK